MEKLVLKVEVPTTPRYQYYTGMTTEMLEQPELPPPKGLWLLNAEPCLLVGGVGDHWNSFKVPHPDLHV